MFQKGFALGLALMLASSAVYEDWAQTSCARHAIPGGCVVMVNATGLPARLGADTCMQHTQHLPDKFPCKYNTHTYGIQMDNVNPNALASFVMDIVWLVYFVSMVSLGVVGDCRAKQVINVESMV